MHYTTFVSAHLGQTLLIFAFIVTVIGGLGSLTGAAIASVLVAVLQQFANVYLSGTGDFIVVAPGRRPAGAPHRPHGEESMTVTTGVPTLVPGRKGLSAFIVGAALVVLMALLPLLNISIPGILRERPTLRDRSRSCRCACVLRSAGALLQPPARHLGMLSFGHALYFGAGAYGLGSC
jgi:ABC-type branched-subunit amino acid transport system permease subunit